MCSNYGCKNQKCVLLTTFATCESVQVNAVCVTSGRGPAPGGLLGAAVPTPPRPSSGSRGSRGERPAGLSLALAAGLLTPCPSPPPPATAHPHGASTCFGGAPPSSRVPARPDPFHKPLAYPPIFCSAPELSGCAHLISPVGSETFFKEDKTPRTVW